MSEVQEQTQNVHKLAEALILARSALAGAEAAAKEYNAAVAAGTQQAELAAAAVHEANVATAKAAAQAAEATLKAAVDGSAARRMQEQAAREAAEATRAAAEQERRAYADAARAAREAAVAVKQAAEAKARAERDAAEAIKQSEREAADAAKQAEQARFDAWKQADARGQAAQAAAEQHARAVQSLTTDYGALARASAASAAGSITSRVSLAGLGTAFAAVSGTVGGLYHVLSESTAEAARHERALRVLGSAYGEVERATAGAMSAEQALNLQGQIQSAGVRVNAQQLGLLARAAREYALATGNDAQQAVEKLSNAIVNNSEDALSELNLAQARSTNSTQTLANMTALLEQRYRGIAPTVQQADERVDAFNRSAKELGSTLGAGLARAAESGLAALFRLGGGAESVTQTMRSFSKEFRDWMNDDPSAMNDASNRALANIQQVRQQYELQRRAFQNSSMLEGSNIRLPGADDLTVRQREAMVRLFEESSRLSNADFQERMRHVLDLAAQERAAADARRSQSELEQQIERTNAADRRAHAGDELGMLRAQAEKLGLRLNMQQQAVTSQQRMNFLQREMGRLLQDEERNRTGIRDAMAEMIQIRQQQQQAAAEASQRARERDELRRVAQELNELYGDADRLDAKIQDVDRRVGESSIEWLRRRVEAQRAVNTAAEEGLSTTKEELALLQEKAEAEEARARAAADEANQRNIDNDRAKQAAQFEQNAQAVARARADSFEQRMRDAFGMAQDQATTSTQAMVEATRAGTGSLRELAESSVSALIEASKSGKDAGAELAAAVDQWAATKAVQWGMQSAESFAGAGLAYFIRPDAVPGLLASGAAYAALALGAGVTAAAIPDATSGGAAAGVRAGEVNSSVGMASARNENAAGMRDQPAVVFNISGVMANEQTQSVLLDAMQQLQDRGLMTG